MRLVNSILRAAITLVLMIGTTILLTVPVYAGNAPRVESMEESLLQEINELRSSKGLSPLDMDADLVKVASIRAKEASSKWSHERPNGTDGVDIIPGNVWKGENLSCCAGDEENILTEDIAVELQFSDMLHSKTHRENMLFDEFGRIGIYSYVDASGKVTTAYLFAS